MNINEIFKGIETAKMVISKNDIKLPNGEQISVKGFGICKDNDYTENSYRYYLEFNIDKPLSKKGQLISILMNPSNKTCPDKSIDGTIQNVIKMAYVTGYSKVVILNSFALIQSTGEKATKTFKNNDDENLNKDFIKEYLNKNPNTNILCAWGEKSKISELKDIDKILKNKFVYSLTKKNYPRHASPYNSKAVNEFILDEFKKDIKDRTFIKVTEIKENGKIGK